MDLDELGLSPSLVRRLEAAGLRSSEDLNALCERELLQIPGLGPRTVEAIKAALGPVGGGLAADPFRRYVCARHGQPAGDAGLSGFFLCPDCTDEWIDAAFAGAAPEWEGEEVTGRCINCNLRRAVRFRQWFLCAVCERVARSIGRSVEAEREVSDTWTRSAGAGWKLRPVDPPRLRRPGSSGGSKVATLDFIVTRRGKKVAGIELKTGRGEIGGTGIGTRIARFQLDVSDCDDIRVAAQGAGVVPYVVHAQVIDRAEPPTVRHVTTGLWWAEYLSLRGAFLETRRRPRENRPAAYFGLDAFRPIDELASHLAAMDFDAEIEKLNRMGWPALYS
jgi:Helix-hairpin-helix domain